MYLIVQGGYFAPSAREFFHFFDLHHTLVFLEFLLVLLNERVVDAFSDKLELFFFLLDAFVFDVFSMGIDLAEVSKYIYTVLLIVILLLQLR